MRDCIKRAIAFVLALCLPLLQSGLIAKADSYWHIVPSPQNFVINGIPVKTTALNINDQNYLKIAEFARLMDIDISCKAETVPGNDSILISFDKTKPFDGVRTADENVRELASMLTGDEIQPPDKYFSNTTFDNGIAYQTVTGQCSPRSQS